MNLIYIALAAFVGGIFSSLLGFLDAKEAFDVRKFFASLLRALVAGIGFAVVYTYIGNVGVLDLAIAFLGGAGIDAGGKRLINVLKG